MKKWDSKTSLVVRMPFYNVLSHKNVRKQHHFGVFLLYKTFPNVWTSSSNILTSVCDVKTSIMRSWKCPKRGHSIMTPYPAWVPNPRLYQLCFPTWATLLWMQAYVWSSKEQELIYFLKLTLCSYDSVLLKKQNEEFRSFMSFSDRLCDAVWRRRHCSSYKWRFQWCLLGSCKCTLLRVQLGL